jgi:hypothetical protein
MMTLTRGAADSFGKLYLTHFRAIQFGSSQHRLHDRWFISTEDVA